MVDFIYLSVFMLRFTAVLFTFMMVTTNLIAQKSVTQQELVWYSFDEQIKLKNNLLVHFLTEERRFMSPSRQHQFFYRGEFYYRFPKNHSIGIGFTHMFQSLPHDDGLQVDVTRPEYRAHVLMKSSTSFEKLKLSNRYVFEWRNFQNVSGTQLVSGFDSNYRIRYRLGIQYEIVDEKLTVVANNETMFNFGERIGYNRFDQNRSFIGLRYFFTPSLSFRAGYIKWFQQRSTGVDFWNRDIIRFTLFHQLNFE